MNYLELINKCLLELNFKPVQSFSELIKNDHKRIKNIINIINNEICNIENWNFLLRKKELTLPASQTEIQNDIDGRILYLFVNGQKYEYSENVEEFVSGNAKVGKYSSMNNLLLFPKFRQDNTINVIYYTKNCVIDENGREKTLFENASDESLIPMPFAQQLLLYGTCLRLKANPHHFKFSYWLGMYNEALSNLKSKTSASALYSPVINLFRK